MPAILQMKDNKAQPQENEQSYSLSLLVALLHNQKPMLYNAPGFKP